MRDFDYHPDEETVRCFSIPDSGILVNDEHACVNQTRQPVVFQPQSGDLVLRHYAFAGEWLKLNATFDLDGNLIQPGPPDTAMAVNCDTSAVTAMAPPPLPFEHVSPDLVPSVARGTRGTW